jgi:REP element-mobilizing transposase RayT
MPQSLARVHVHIVFSTKHRFPFFSDKGLRSEMHAYLGGACNGMDCPVVVVGGVADHVHLLCLLSRKRTIAEFLKEIKGQSSRWVKSKGSAFRKFEWQRGYGIFSVSESGVPTVKRYIEMQEQHHRKKQFKEEYRTLLMEYGIMPDERYVWD